LAFAFALRADGRIGLRFALEWPEAFNMPTARAAVIAHAVQVDGEVRCGVCVDVERQRFAGFDCGMGDVAFDADGAVFCLWIDGRLGEHPVLGARFLILFDDGIGRVQGEGLGQGAAQCGK
jgi:hypothetical protein